MGLMYVYRRALGLVLNCDRDCRYENAQGLHFQKQGKYGWGMEGDIFVT